MKKYKKEKTKIWYQKAFDLISNALKKYLIKKATNKYKFSYLEFERK